MKINERHIRRIVSESLKRIIKEQEDIDIFYSEEDDEGKQANQAK